MTEKKVMVLLGNLIQGYTFFLHACLANICDEWIFFQVHQPKKFANRTNKEYNLNICLELQIVCMKKKICVREYRNDFLTNISLTTGGE